MSTDAVPVVVETRSETATPVAQRDRRQASRLITTCLAIALAASALILLGILDLRRRPPPRLLLSAGHAWDYVRAIEREVSQAQSRVWVAVYVARLPDEPDDQHPVIILFNALVAAHRRGVDVQICLDRSMEWDEPEVMDPKHEAPVAWLREHGLTVIEDDLERTTHAKVVLIDDHTVILGSHNWTGSALMRNREVSVLIRDAALVAEVEAEVFEPIVRALAVP